MEKREKWLLIALFVVMSVAFVQYFPKASSDMASWVQAFGSIGALGVAIGLYYRQNERVAADERAKSRADVRRMLCSLRDEICLSVSEFEDASGQHIKNGVPGEPHNWYVPIHDQPFPIYQAHIDRIGTIEDDELRRLIIMGYGKASGVLQSLRFNNVLLDRHAHALYMAESMRDSLHFAKEKMALKQLSAYGDEIRGSYKDALDQADKLVKALDLAISKGELARFADSRT